MVRRCLPSSTTDKRNFYDKQSWCGIAFQIAQSRIPLGLLPCKGWCVAVSQAAQPTKETSMISRAGAAGVNFFSV